MTEGVIVIGASRGIGAALARAYAERGWEVGLAARSTDELETLAAQLSTQTAVATMDVTEPNAAREAFDDLAETLSSVDVVVLSAGIGPANRELAWEPERDTIDVNVRGFAALATAAIDHLEATGGGSLVGLSSVAAHLGNGAVPAYHASKAFVSRYCEGLRYRQGGRNPDVQVTTVEPGYVDTELSMGDFWECSPETAAAQIVRAVDRGRKHVYVTRRWRLVAWAVELLPERLLGRSMR